MEYVQRGLDYIYRSTLLDILLIVVPIFFVVLSVLWKNSKMMTISIGCMLYIIYVIFIGGDFMAGRHLTTPFFVSFMGLIALFYMSEEEHKSIYSLKKILMIFIVLQTIWATCSRPIAKEYLYEVTWNSAETGVADERDWYYEWTGFIPYVSSMLQGDNAMKEFLKVSGTYDQFVDKRESGQMGCAEDNLMLSGIVNYYVQKDGVIYLTDKFGLMDPLLSHLPAKWEENWRIGHMWREIPKGYSETIATGTNRIEDESLHEYYDKVLLIIQGDIWDKERIKTIVKMNLGQYDYLIEEYLNSKLPK